MGPCNFDEGWEVVAPLWLILACEIKDEGCVTSYYTNIS